MIKIFLFLASFSLFSEDKFINEYKPNLQRIDSNVEKINEIMTRLKALEAKVIQLESAPKSKKTEPKK